jgi:hypothetical protein
MAADVIHPNGGTLRPWRPGQSGNPGGRPKGLPGYVRRKCGRNGQKLIDALYCIAFGDEKARREMFGERVAWPSLKDRTAAIEILLTRGFGRPAQADDGSSPLGERPFEVIINLPRPPKALEGRRVTTGMFDAPETEPVISGGAR